MSARPSDDDEVLAAEIAFGLLDPPERQVTEARLGSDGAFAEVHARWQSYTTAMFDASTEVPSTSVWSAIEARVPANDPVPSSFMPPRWWRASAVAGTFIAVILGFTALQKPQKIVVRVPVAQVVTAPMVAVLTGKTGFVTVSFDRASGHITSAVSRLDIGNHSPELWVIPVDGKPRSLGVMNASSPAWIKVPTVASSLMAAGVTIAVSVEPVGGSSTGQPTGPVILTGKLVTT